MIRHACRHTASLAMVIICCLATGQGLRAQLKQMETADARVVYLDPLQTGLAPYITRALENALRHHRDLFQYEPWEEPTLLLRDIKDFGGAAATPLPRNIILLDLAPGNFAYETYPANERINTWLNHEVVHLMMTDMAAPRDRRARRFFGGKVQETSDHPETMFYSYLTNPRFAAPRWYQEGVAVFMETWMAGGIGRAQGSYDEMVFRAKVLDDVHIYDPLGLASEGTKTDFLLGTNSYLYGTRFVSYLAYAWSPDHVRRWASRTKGSKPSYAGQFEQVFGEPLKEAWAGWIAFEQEFQQTNLAAIREYPVTPYTDISGQALGTVSRAYLDEDHKTLYAAFNYPGVVPHLGAISLEDGSIRRLQEIKGPAGYTVTSLAWDPGRRKLYYTTDNMAWRDLYILDPDSGDARRLLKDARLGDIVLNQADSSIWGARHFNGIVTLVRIPDPYLAWEQMLSLPYGQVAYDLDLSPDGSLLALSLGGIDGHHVLQVHATDKIRAGIYEPVKEFDLGTALPGNFTFTPDGRYLLGNSYLTGVSNLFRFDLETGVMEALTNTETGLFRPLTLDDDGGLLAFRYTGDGFVLTKLQVEPIEDINPITFLGERTIAKHPELAEWQAPPPSSVDLEQAGVQQGDYKGFKSIQLESVYPIVEGYKNLVAYGARINLSDPLTINTLNLNASYSPYEDLPSEERLHVSLDYKRYNWRAFIHWNRADFYDLAGPTEVSRKGYAVGLGQTKVLLYDDPRHMDLRWGVTAYGNLDRLPYFQNIEATFDKYYSSYVTLDYRNSRASLGAVDYEKGWTGNFILLNTAVDGEWIPGGIGRVDVGLPLPLHHSSFWIRSYAGGMVGDPDNNFANLYFGGFGNNYLDHQDEQRYRRWYAFPGLELNEVGGRNFAKVTLDWNLPPIVFRRVGGPGFYLTWMRSAIFAGGLRTNMDDASRRIEAANVGAQMDFRFTALHRMPMTLSIGYARAFRQAQDSQDEIMVSLKILR